MLKGMVMVTRSLVIAGIVLAIVAAVVLGQAGGTGQATPKQWEYGVFLGEPLWSWYTPGATVDHLSSGDFARKMGTAESSQGPALEANVLNALGAQGWELVTVAERSKYILRRQK
jgi:hypothetical protein